MPVPARLLGLLLCRRARRTGLVQQNHHRFAQPLQNFHLGHEVARVVRVFGGVHQVQHHVGRVSCSAHGLLAKPESAVPIPVHHLPQKPANGVVCHAQALHQPHRIAKTGRVPQLQQIALRRGQKSVQFRHGGDVRRITHLAYVKPKQCSGQGCFARIGMRDQCQLDRSWQDMSRQGRVRQGRVRQDTARHDGHDGHGIQCSQDWPVAGGVHDRGAGRVWPGCEPPCSAWGLSKLTTRTATL